MTPDTEREAARICEAALDRPALEREAFIVEECAGDEALRREVESLLRQLSKADEFLQRPALDVAAERMVVPHTLVVGQQFGPYQIQGRLGAGGMGEVYRARDTKLGREVAIKVLPRSLHERSGTPRPLRSRSARARRRSITPTSPRSMGSKTRTACGALVLELVEGPTLADRIAQRPDSARRGAAHREADRRGARSGARARHRPSRPEARQHQAAARRSREGAGLRAGQGARTNVCRAGGSRHTRQRARPGR